MFKLNSKSYVTEIKNNFKIVKATEIDLISTIESNLKNISDNLEYLDETKITKEETAHFVQFIKDELFKIKQPYEYAKENLTSIEFYLKDLLKKEEDFLNYNMQSLDEGIHGLS